MATFPSIFTDVDHNAEACLETWYVHMWLDIFSVSMSLLDKVVSESYSNSSTSSTPKSENCQSSRLQQITCSCTLSVSVCVHLSVYFVTTWGCWLLLISVDKDNVSLKRIMKDVMIHLLSDFHITIWFLLKRWNTYQLFGCKNECSYISTKLNVPSHTPALLHNHSLMAAIIGVSLWYISPVCAGLIH